MYKRQGQEFAIFWNSFYKGTSRFQFLNNLKSKIEIGIILIEKVIFFFCLIPELVKCSVKNFANEIMQIFLLLMCVACMFKAKTRYVYCAADFSLLNLPKGKSLGRSKPATNS